MDGILIKFYKLLQPFIPLFAIYFIFVSLLFFTVKSYNKSELFLSYFNDFIVIQKYWKDR